MPPGNKAQLPEVVTTATAVPTFRLKRTRAKRSCDFCRGRKARCDADERLPCTNCTTWNVPCEFSNTSKKRAAPNQYVEALEERCKKMETLLETLTNCNIADLEADQFLPTIPDVAGQQSKRRHSSYRGETSAGDDGTGHGDDSLDDHRQSGETMYRVPQVGSDDDSDSSATGSDSEDGMRTKTEPLDANEERKMDLVDANPMQSLSQSFSKLKVSYFPSIKYMAAMTGLQLIDKDMFKDGDTIPWPGKKDVVIQRLKSRNDELVVVKTESNDLDGTSESSDVENSDGEMSQDLETHKRNFQQAQAARSKHRRSSSIGVSPQTDEREPSIDEGSVSSRRHDVHYAWPPREFCDHLIDLYLTKLHPTMPILNRHSFSRRYHTHHPSPIHPFLLNAIFAVTTLRFITQDIEVPENVSISISRHTGPTTGRHTSPDTSPQAWSPSSPIAAMEDGQKRVISPVTLAKLFYHRAMEGYIRDFGRPKLAIVQGYLVLAMYFEVNGDGDDSRQWFATGAAIRVAQDIGLHKNCSNWKIAKSEIELRKRIWYACYIMDRWMGALMGRPLAILERNFDVDMPEMFETEEFIFDPENPMHPKPATKEDLQPQLFDHFIQMIKLADVMGRIINGLYETKAKTYRLAEQVDTPDPQHLEEVHAIVHMLDRKLTQWKLSLNESLQFEVNGSKAPGNISPFAGSLQVCYYTVLLLLHRPFIAPNYEGAESNAFQALYICTNAATNILEIFQHEGEHEFLCYSESLLIYTLFQSGLVHLHNANGQHAYLNHFGKLNLKRCLAVLERKRFWGMAQRSLDVLKMLIALKDINLDSMPGATLSEMQLVDVERPKPAQKTSSLGGESTKGGSERRVSALTATTKPTIEFVTTNNATRGGRKGSASAKLQRKNSVHRDTKDDGSLYNFTPNLPGASGGIVPVPVSQQPQPPKINLENIRLMDPDSGSLLELGPNIDSRESALNANHALESWSTFQEANVTSQPMEGHVDLQPPLTEEMIHALEEHQLISTAADPLAPNDETNVEFWNVPTSFSWNDWDNYIGHIQGSG
ncbi:hypothetical protein BZG36_03451 [Bifiguratus adelaidae]|uniref:Zn(2)-C6 fungal-type domain-containing protein n=1 Tax=Bifiguratus adelaidae TaxID=1938954 RepID=A0A261XXZ4_9FUNG|nr:hypothetical protein BZG36_03451 [Bifiguratus adelaidae]